MIPPHQTSAGPQSNLKTDITLGNTAEMTRLNAVTQHKISTASFCLSESLCMTMGVWECAKEFCSSSFV